MAGIEKVCEFSGECGGWVGADLPEEVIINEFILEGFVREKLRNRIWITSGKEIPIQRMGDIHIYHTINWLESNPHYPFSDEWIELLKVELESRELC